MEKKLWYAAFDREAIPAFPCPHCQAPKLELDRDTLRVEQAAYSKANMKHPEWEPEWAEERLCSFLDARQLAVARL